MDLTQQLLDLLNRYIEEFKKIKEDFNQKRTIQTLFEELLIQLKENSIEENKIIISIILNTIYGNNIYVDEFYRILLKPDNEEELNQFISKIEKEYEEVKREAIQLNQRINRNYEVVSSAYRVRKSILLQTKILDKNKDLFNIKRIISYFEMSGAISNRDEILLINEIELYNRKVWTKHASKEEQEYTESLCNEMPNILTMGFQELEEIEVSKDRKNTLDNFATEIINLIKHIEKGEIVELLEKYQRYNIDNNEYYYIIEHVLKELLDDLITLYTLLLDKDIYTRRNQRIEVIKDYYTILDRYTIIMNYYNKLTEYAKDERTEEPKETNINNFEKKRLIYSRSNTIITKSKLISDMSDVPYEYYDTIYDLLNRFKNGTLSKNEITILKNHKKFNGHIELRYDQVRIIIRHVKDDIYNVLGVFAKKDDKDIPMYKTITKRENPDISTDDKLTMQLELSKHTEEELAKLVQEKARKNSR